MTNRRGGKRRERKRITTKQPPWNTRTWVLELTKALVEYAQSLREDRIRRAER